MATCELDVVRPEGSNVQSIISVLIAKLKTKCSQKQKCEYKLETGSSDNLLPFSIYKMFFSTTNIEELSKSISTK